MLRVRLGDSKDVVVGTVPAASSSRLQADQPQRIAVSCNHSDTHQQSSFDMMAAHSLIALHRIAMSEHMVLCLWVPS